jgi:hypothetical protein
VLGHLAVELRGGHQQLGQPPEGPHPVQHGGGDRRGQGHVQAEHLHRPAGPEHDRGRLRVGEDVELGGGIVVAPGEGAAHDHQVAGPLDDARLTPYGQGEVGERPDRHQRDLPGRGPQGVDDAVHRVPLGHREQRRRQDGPAETGVAVDVTGADGAVHEGAGAAGGDRDVAEAEELPERQRVGRGQGEIDVAADGGDGDEVEAGGTGGEGERHGVVDARVAIDEDFGHVTVRYEESLHKKRSGSGSPPKSARPRSLWRSRPSLSPKSGGGPALADRGPPPRPLRCRSYGRSQCFRPASTLPSRMQRLRHNAVEYPFGERQGLSAIHPVWSGAGGPVRESPYGPPYPPRASG